MEKGQKWELVKAFAGGAAGMLASFAMGKLLKANAPAMDSKAKQIALDAGMSLTASAVGTFVANDAEMAVDSAKALCDQVKESLGIKENTHVEVTYGRA